TVSNNTLFIDGGEIRRFTNTTSDPVPSLPTTISTIDLSQTWNNADTKIWKYLKKTTSVSAPGPPSLNDGAIFSNGSSLWLYGGVVSQAPKNEPVIPPNGIWRYDIAASQWSQPSAGGDPVQRLFRGTSIQAGNSGAFYLGGAKSPLGDAVFHAEKDAKDQYLVQGLLKFDEYKQTFNNISTIGLNQKGTVSDSYLSYIKAFGSQGVLVAFGGITIVPGKNVNYGNVDREDPRIQFSMQNITVYDIASHSWYQQQATGDIPSWRYMGCAVAVSAADQSSHSIYVFGGWTSGAADGNVYVLSIPSFTWIRVTRDTDPRWRHKCHLISNNHMLVVGGQRPQVDSPLELGILGCDNNPNFSQGLGIFSLNNHTWTTTYDPVVGATPYQIHPSISDAIGGNITGGATKRSPDQGFSSDALRELLGMAKPSVSGISPSPPILTTSIDNTARPHASRTINTGAIAGIVVGSVIFTILSLGFIWFSLSRRRRYLQRLSLDNKSNEQTGPANPPLNIPVEADAGPAGLELRSRREDELVARVYRSHEVHNATERYELPFATQEHAMPSHFKTHEVLVPFELSGCQTYGGNTE
ncbi:MAG: hypothetical protein Q9179_007398, partial [Wetmoreana sp. 5 TL-2023]